MNEDFEEFFALLNRQGVEFLVIGGVAYNYHAPPRATKDIDVWDEAWGRRITLDYGAAPIGVLSITDLIQSKRSAGRPRDLADVDMLEKIMAKRRRQR